MNFEEIARFYTIEMSTHNNHFTIEIIKEKFDSCKLIFAHAKSSNTNHIIMKSIKSRLLVRENQMTITNVYCEETKCVLFRNDSIDEIFAFEFRKWTIALAAKKKIFDFIDTFDETAKNSFAFDIESTSNISFDWNRCCTIDMKISKKEIFESTRIFAQKSKNSFVLKIQFSQMCCNQNSVDIIWRKKN